MVQLNVATRLRDLSQMGDTDTSIAEFTEVLLTHTHVRDRYIDTMLRCVIADSKFSLLFAYTVQ